MAVRAPGDYDPNTGWPPDDSTGVQWDPETELPGQFKGGGAGFGPGGFQGSPKLTAPAVGPPPGLSLSNGGGGGAPAPGGWRNPFTSLHIDPATGQPEMLTGPGGIAEKTRGSMNPFGFVGRGNPYWRGAIAAGGVLTPTPAETGELSPRFLTGQGVQPGLSAPQGAPYEVPRGMPGRAVDAPATYPHMPWPDTGVAPAASPQAPAAPAASPAATRQRPNLGTYGTPPAVVANSPFTTFDRPNMSPQNSAQGRQGASQMGMLDLSRLFGGGQPAPAAAAPAAAPYPPPRPIAPVYKQPSIREVPPGPMDPSIIARQGMRRPKSSSSSQGGGY